MTGRLRRGGVGPLPATAYVDITDVSLPESVADLELVPGVCLARFDVGRCDQAAPQRLCLDCSLRDVGESWELLTTRTNAGVPKAKFYRDLDRAQSVPDPTYKRLMAWKRRADPRG